VETDLVVVKVVVEKAKDSMPMQRTPKSQRMNPEQPNPLFRRALALLTLA